MASMQEETVRLVRRLALALIVIVALAVGAKWALTRTTDDTKGNGPEIVATGNGRGTSTDRGATKDRSFLNDDDEDEVPATAAAKPEATATPAAAGTSLEDLMAQELAGLKTDDTLSTESLEALGAFGYTQLPDGTIVDAAGRVIRAAGETGTGGLGRNPAHGLTAEQIRAGLGTDTQEVSINPTPTPEPQEGQGFIGGRVRRGGEFVQGAQLTLVNDTTNGTFQTSSNHEGSYTFPPVDPGPYSVVLNAPNAPAPVRRLVLEPNQSRLNEDYTLPLLAPVPGRVVNDHSDEGVRGARLQVSEGSRQISVLFASESGEFTLPPIEEGRYYLRVTAERFTSSERDFVVVDSFDSQEFLEVRLTPSLQVLGRVLLPSGAPAAGAYVVPVWFGSIFGDPYRTMDAVITDTSGQFILSTFPANPTEPFRVAAWADGTVASFSDEVYDPMDGASFLNEATVRLRAGSEVTGVVEDQDGEPVEGAEVSIASGFPTASAIMQRLHVAMPKAYSDAEGRISFISIEEGATTYRVSATGFASLEEVRQTAGALYDLGVLTLESTDAQEGRVFGVVTDEQGLGLGGHNVYLKCYSCAENTSRYAATDGQGHFLFDELPDGDYFIAANGAINPQGIFITIDQKVSGIRPGDQAQYVVYDHGQSLRMRVLDASGQPVARVRVGVHVRNDLATGGGGQNDFWQMRYDYETQTSGGVVELPKLMAGRAALTISATGSGSLQLPGVDIAPGGRTNLGDVYLEGSTEITGRVTGSHGGPGISGATVRALAPLSAASDHPLNVLPITATTGATGQFVLRNVPIVPGVDVQAEAEGYVTLRLPDLTVEESRPLDLGDVVLDPAGRITGRVTDPQGNGLMEVFIRGEGILSFTDAQGYYSINNAQEGELVLFFEDRTGRHHNQEVPVTTVAGSTTPLNVTLLPK